MPKSIHRGRLELHHQEQATNPGDIMADTASDETSTISETLLIRKTVHVASSPFFPLTSQSSHTNAKVEWPSIEDTSTGNLPLSLSTRPTDIEGYKTRKAVETHSTSLLAERTTAMAASQDFLHWPPRGTSPSIEEFQAMFTRSSTQRLLFDTNADADLVDLETKLNALESRSLFAGRYRIDPERIAGIAHGRYAVERASGREVFLKFFIRRRREDYENAVKMHRALHGSHQYVCRLFEAIEDADGFPPCLVLERGQYSLANRIAMRPMATIEQKALLHSVLETLEGVHAEGIVHGNLDPSHLMWFATDYSWKLISLGKASRIGETSVLSDARQYASPETLRAVATENGEIRREASMDMWSFGILSFELLTRSSVGDDATGVQAYINRRLAEQTELDGRNGSQWPSSLQNESHEHQAEEQNLAFVQSFLHERPEERQTARHALTDVFFGTTSQAKQHSESGAEEEYQPPFDLYLHPNAFLHLIRHNFDRLLDIECFVDNQDASLPYYERQTQDALAFFDDYLPHDPINIIRLGHTFRLSLNLSCDEGLGVPLVRVVSVSVTPPDGDGQLLDLVQWREKDSISAFAHVDPTQFASTKLNMISPYFGLLDRKYVKLSVCTTVLLGDGCGQEVDIHDMLFFKIVRPKDRMRFHKFLGMFVTKEEKHRRQQRTPR